jgi:signal transduction histidine kinase
MRIRTSLALPPRSIALEAFIATLSGLSVSAVSWGPDAGVLPIPLVASASLVLGVLLFLLRRTSPLVPFLFCVALSAFSPAIGGALPVTAYAVGRYSGRSAVRIVASVAGFLAVTRLWLVPDLEDALNALATVAFIVFLPGAVGAYVRTRADLMDALQSRAERAEAERELLAKDAVLTERSRIAREMHDAVGHRVSLMVLQAGAIEMAAADRDRVEQLACQVQLAGRQALDELRQAVGILRDGEDDGAPLAPQPGLEDLDRLVKELRSAGMTVELSRRDATAEPVDGVVSRAAYRIVQEALTNAGKHAPGAPVAVTVERTERQLVVRITNAAAREPSRAAGGGFGLVGLGERVRTLDGVLRAEPRLDGGFLVEAVLPA